MLETAAVARWQGFGTSVRGAAHRRVGLPNQDAIGWLPAAGQGGPWVLAVADGHGSATSFRSDIGARLAVDAAVTLLYDLVASQPWRFHLSALNRIAHDRLPRALVRTWRGAVQAHQQTHPFTAAEWERLAHTQAHKTRQMIEHDPVLAYGTTLLAVVAADAFLLYVQLGDGDILFVTDAGEVGRPWPPLPPWTANETASLCLTRAWCEVQIRFQVCCRVSPALMLLTTDGYANSFPNDAAFRQVGPDLLACLRAEGADAVRGALPGWLRETSRHGSGDDITLGVLYRPDALI